MVIGAGAISAVAGLPPGIFLATSSKGGLFAAPRLNRLLGIILNLAGSTPFIVLAIAIIPLTRLTGTSAGASAALVPLAIVATFVAKTVESGELAPHPAAAIIDALGFVSRAGKCLGGQNPDHGAHARN